MPSAVRLGLLVVSLFTLAQAPAAVISAVPEFRVVVNAANPLQSVQRTLLRDLFLKRETRWPDGAAALPVDLIPRARARRSFDEQILGRSVAAVRNAWEQSIFSGRDVPPPELATDAEVLRYVASHRGAVGYVARDTVLPPTVHAVKVQ